MRTAALLSRTDILKGLRAARCGSATAPLSAGSARQRKSAGFSLIELLIIIAIVAILGTIAGPSFSAFIASQRIKTASFDLMTMLTLSRSEAIKRNADVVATPATGGWQNGWTVTAADGTVLNQQNALPGVTIGDAPASVTYAASGRLTGAATLHFEISSTSSSSVRCITIDLSGRPNSKEGAC